MIALAEVERGILKAFEEKQSMDTEMLRLQILGHDKGVRVDVESDVYEMEVSVLDVNHRSRQFGATLTFRSDNGRAQEIALNGRFEEVVEVPVLVSRLPAKQVISWDDIRFETLPLHRVDRNMVQDPDYLVGKMLRRSVSVGRPVRARDVMEPLLVERNTTVTMVYETPFMSIKTMAVALEDGGKGDVIRVRNTTSSRIVQAVIQDETMVSVAQFEGGRS